MLRGRSGTAGRGTEMLVRAEVVVASPMVVVSSVGGGWGGSGCRQSPSLVDQERLKDHIDSPCGCSPYRLTWLLVHGDKRAPPPVARWKNRWLQHLSREKKHLSAGKQAPDYSEVVRKALCSATFQRREQKSTQKGRELLYATCLRVAFKRCIFGAAAFAKAMSSFCLSAPLGHPPRLLRGKGACERRLRHKQAKVHRSSFQRLT